MTDLTAFLEHNVEGYVFDDLRRMESAGVGYPMVMTAFAGIELLGGLLSKKPFDTNAGRVYFPDYWAQYLYPARPRSKEAGESIYQLVRHGIAHAYVLKGSIGVLARREPEHLTVRAGLLLVDAAQLADDLIDSYERRVRPLIAATAGAVNGATMTARLAEMEKAYDAQACKIALAKFFPTAPVPVAGATGPMPRSGAPVSDIYGGASGPRGSSGRGDGSQSS